MLERAQRGLLLLILTVPKVAECLAAAALDPDAAEACVVGHEIDSIAGPSDADPILTRWTVDVATSNVSSVIITTDIVQHDLDRGPTVAHPLGENSQRVPLGFHGVWVSDAN